MILSFKLLSLLHISLLPFLNRGDGSRSSATFLILHGRQLYTHGMLVTFVGLLKGD